MNSKSPNLQVGELDSEFQVLAMSANWDGELSKLQSDFRDSFRELGRKQAFFTDCDFSRMGLINSLLSTLRKSPIPDKRTGYMDLLNAIRILDNRITRVESKIEKQKSRIDTIGKSAEKTLQKLATASAQLGSVQRRLYLLSNYLTEGPGRFLGESQILFLEGPWGSGKTHYLCEFSLRAQKTRTSTIFVTAPGIEECPDPIDSLIRSLGLSCSSRNFLDQLNSLGAKSGGRFLLMIDSINEGDLEKWISWLEAFSCQIGEFPHIGLVVSCRTDSVQISFHRRSSKGIRRVDHPGFDGIEFEAQTIFFDFYEIDPRGMPLLTPEFSNPLVLKMICESVKKFKPEKRNVKFREITSGQKGVNHIFEYFAKDLGKEIERVFGLPRKFCWWLLKGQQRNSVDIGLAGKMAEEERVWLTVEEVSQVMTLTNGFIPGIEEGLRKALVKEGLLVAVSQYDFASKKYYSVYSFSYQRFGDHLIARYLMGKYLKTQTEFEVYDSLIPGSKIGKLFDPTDNSHGFQFSNLGSAVMTEFPERLSNKYSRSEVISYLPQEKHDAYYLKDIFLESLSWRAINNTNFSEETFGYISYYLMSDIDNLRDDAFEALMTLSIRKKSDILADFLWRVLSSFSMAERDLVWSEYLRRCYPPSSVYRLLSWFENGYPATKHQDIEKSHVMVLAFMLSMTTLGMRDRATRALFYAGLANCELLFGEFFAFLKLNDLYICERYLAAIYGVYLAKWSALKTPSERAPFVEFARDLSREFRSKGSLIGSSHSLIEDYVLGIIEYGFKIDSAAFSLSEVKFALKYADVCSLPRPSVQGIKNSKSSPLVDDFFGDFFNYTIGQLVPGRRNYDDDDPLYKQYLSYIAKRMIKLGFKPEVFKETDSKISQNTFAERYVGKSERYMKKYAKIAYFELRGWLRGHGRIDRELFWEREPESDIDPSFPRSSPNLVFPFQVPKKDLLLDLTSWLNLGCFPQMKKFFKMQSEGDGVSEQWLLLDASVDRWLPNQRRLDFRVHSYVCSALTLVDEDICVEIKDYLASWDGELRQTPRNIFAGELPSSKYFGLTGDEVIEDFTFTPHKFELRNGLIEERLDLFHTSVSWNMHGSLSSSGESTSAVSLSPILSEVLKVRNATDTFDLFDEDGECVSKYFNEESWPRHSRGHSLWVRKNVLDRYLTDNGLVLVYSLKGERSFTFADGEHAFRAAYLDALRSTTANRFTTFNFYDGRIESLRSL